MLHRIGQVDCFSRYAASFLEILWYPCGVSGKRLAE